MLDDKIRYIFKQDYICSIGKINEGREITYFRGLLYLEGVIVVEPYATEIKKMFDDDKFVKEYIKQEHFIKNKV